MVQQDEGCLEYRGGRPLRSADIPVRLRFSAKTFADESFGEDERAAPADGQVSAIHRPAALGFHLSKINFKKSSYR